MDNTPVAFQGNPPPNSAAPKAKQLLMRTQNQGAAAEVNVPLERPNAAPTAVNEPAAYFRQRPPPPVAKAAQAPVQRPQGRTREAPAAQQSRAGPRRPRTESDQTKKQLFMGPFTVPFRLLFFMQRYGAHREKHIFYINSSKAETVGLYRALVSGANITPDRFSLHVAATCLKMCLREMPSPTLDCYEEIIKLSARGEKDLSAVRSLLRKYLPKPNRVFLGHLIDLLSSIAQNAAVTRMDAKALAYVFGPALIRPTSNELDPETVMVGTKAVNDTIKLMIDYNDRIFVVRKEGRAPDRDRRRSSDHRRSHKRNDSRRASDVTDNFSNRAAPNDFTEYDDVYTDATASSGQERHYSYSDVSEQGPAPPPPAEAHRPPAPSMPRTADENTMPARQPPITRARPPPPDNMRPQYPPNAQNAPVVEYMEPARTDRNEGVAKPFGRIQIPKKSPQISQPPPPQDDENQLMYGALESAHAHPANDLQHPLKANHDLGNAQQEESIEEFSGGSEISSINSEDEFDNSTIQTEMTIHAHRRGVSDSLGAQGDSDMPQVVTTPVRTVEEIEEPLSPAVQEDEWEDNEDEAKPIAHASQDDFPASELEEPREPARGTDMENGAFMHPAESDEEHPDFSPLLHQTDERRAKARRYLDNKQNEEDEERMLFDAENDSHWEVQPAAQAIRVDEQHAIESSQQAEPSRPQSSVNLPNVQERHLEAAAQIYRPSEQENEPKPSRSESVVDGSLHEEISDFSDGAELETDSFPAPETEQHEANDIKQEPVQKNGLLNRTMSAVTSMWPFGGKQEQSFAQAMTEQSQLEQRTVSSQEVGRNSRRLSEESTDETLQSFEASRFTNPPPVLVQQRAEGSENVPKPMARISEKRENIANPNTQATVVALNTTTKIHGFNKGRLVDQETQTIESRPMNAADAGTSTVEQVTQTAEISTSEQLTQTERTEAKKEPTWEVESRSPSLSPSISVFSNNSALPSPSAESARTSIVKRQEEKKSAARTSQRSSPNFSMLRVMFESNASPTRPTPQSSSFRRSSGRTRQSSGSRNSSIRARDLSPENGMDLGPPPPIDTDLSVDESNSLGDLSKGTAATKPRVIKSWVKPQKPVKNEVQAVTQSSETTPSTWELEKTVSPSKWRKHGDKWVVE